MDQNYLRDYGTRLGESGAEAVQIMRLMGHSSVIISQRYVHPSSDSLESAYERMLLRQLTTVSTTLGSEGVQATQ